MLGRDRNTRSLGDPEEGEDLPGLREGFAGRPRAQAQAAGLLPRGLRLQEGRRGQGDVHHQGRDPELAAVTVNNSVNVELYEIFFVSNIFSAASWTWWRTTAGRST